MLFLVLSHSSISTLNLQGSMHFRQVDLLERLVDIKSPFLRRGALRAQEGVRVAYMIIKHESGSQILREDLFAGN